MGTADNVNGSVYIASQRMTSRGLDEVSDASAAPKTTNSPDVASFQVAAPPPLPLSARRSEVLDLNTVERKGKPLPGWREPASRAHLGGIPEAPTLRPTEAEWQDPMQYMRDVAELGRRYGIVKIIPPDSWNPDFAIDTQCFDQVPLTAGSRANMNYLDQLQKFHKHRGSTLARLPSVDKRPLDLYELRRAVHSRGGFDKVCDRKKWAEVGRVLGYSGKIMSSLSTSLKHSYEKWLHPYEMYLAGVKPSVQQQLEQERGGPYGTPSPGTSPFSPMKRSNPHTPSQLANSPLILATQALNAAIETHDTASQPEYASPRPSGFTPANAGFTAANAQPQRSFTPVNGVNGHGHAPLETPINGTPRSLPGKQMSNGPAELKRSFSDISAGTREKTTHEAKRVKRETSSSAKGAPTVRGSHISQHKPSSLLPKTGLESDENCEACGKPGTDEAVICEGCDNTYHKDCLVGPPPDVANGEFHCPRCLVGTGDFGFEEGSTYSLRQFQIKANEFKERHFKGKTPYDPVTDTAKPVTEDDVEREFWRLVQNLNETVEVEYGADIHSTTHGSGFPTVERDPRNAYSLDPWNLNVLPLHQESLFKHIKTDISGMTSPWLYVGMCFSTFCWHNEDHYAYSANYQHFGATKTWYGIPGKDAEKFEAAMKDAVPDLFESQPDLLFQLVTLLPPEQLRKAGVNVYAIDQRAGQFVVTFPQAYHAGFNHGFNFNEAVNFAPADWEPFGRAGVERLREFRKQPCFSHDELLLTAAANKDIPIKTAKWLQGALLSIQEREWTLERQFAACVEQIDGDNYFRSGDEAALRFENSYGETEGLTEDELLCGFCKAYCYFTRFHDKISGQSACLDHISRVDWGPGDHAFTLQRIQELSQFDALVSRVRDIAFRPEAWREKFRALTKGSEKPSLKVMRSLLTEGERIPWPLKELWNLKRTVDACNEWVEEAINFISRKQQSRRKEKAWRKSSVAKGAEAEDREKEFRKISNIKRLLLRADLLCFDCPEIETLQEKLTQVREWQNGARDVIENITTHTSSEISGLIETGKSFSLDIPELDSLERIVDQMQWVEKAKDPSQSSTLTQLNALLEEAEKFDVPITEEHVQHLRSQKVAGEQLASQFAECLAQETINLSQLEALSAQAESLPVSEDTLVEVNAFLKKQRDAQRRIYEMIDLSKSSEYRKRPTYKDFRECMEGLAELTSKPDGIAGLERQQKRHEDWMRRGKKLFGKTNAPLHILMQHLMIVQERNRFCLDTTEQMKPPVEPISREHTPEAEVLDGQPSLHRDVFCLCRKPEDGMMLECRICQEWYHNKCLKIARGKIKDDDDFVCPICDHRVKIPRDAIRPKLEELMAWQAEMPDLPFRPDEEHVVENIVNQAIDFRDYIAPFMSNPMIATMEEVPTLRFYLRKIEGADILLANETNFFRQELYRFQPIAPKPPPVIEFSASTRKPRPTKQQKLMKEHGVETAEDLPAELRTKHYGGRKRNQDKEREQQQVATGSDRSSQTPALNFRPPLSNTGYPRGVRSDGTPYTSADPQSLYTESDPSSQSQLGNPHSPHYFGSGKGSASPGSVMNSHLFGHDVGFEREEDGENANLDQASGAGVRILDIKNELDNSADLHTPTAFVGDEAPTIEGDGEGTVHHTDPNSANYDSIFADLTNQDEAKEHE